MAEVTTVEITIRYADGTVDVGTARTTSEPYELGTVRRTFRNRLAHRLDQMNLFTPVSWVVQPSSADVLAAQVAQNARASRAGLARQRRLAKEKPPARTDA